MDFLRYRVMRTQLWTVIVFLLGGNFVLPSVAIAQGGGAAPRRAAENAWVKKECAQGVELRLSSIEPRQGSLQLVEIRSAKQLAEVSGRWDGNEIPFWSSDSASKSDFDVHRALLGIDLEHASGKADLVISAKSVEGESFACTVSLDVREGRFATEKLNV
ncbi:MAG TPA: hypothetical protein VIH76_07925, partial [Candidatus Acidoferrales bacterium]